MTGENCIEVAFGKEYMLNVKMRLENNDYNLMISYYDPIDDLMISGPGGVPDLNLLISDNIIISIFDLDCPNNNFFDEAGEWMTCILNLPGKR